MSNIKIGLTIEEAAECTGIGRNTMRKLVDWGKLPVLKVGRKAIIRRDTLERFMSVNVQAFMRTFREMESVVEQYSRDLAEWERQTSRKPSAAAKEQRRPPEKQSVLKHLREIQDKNRQKPPQRQRKKSIDRDSR